MSEIPHPFKQSKQSIMFMLSAQSIKMLRQHLQHPREIYEHLCSIFARAAELTDYIAEEQCTGISQ